MKLYLKEFGKKEFIEFPYTVPQETVSSFLEDDAFTAQSDLKFQLKAHKLGKTIQITGSVDGVFGYECGRCLLERSYTLETPLDVVYVEQTEWQEENDDVELTEEDIGVWFYSGDFLELDPSLRDTVLLALPIYAICPPEEQDSCNQALETLIAEANLDRDRIQALEEEAVDERWSKLQALKVKLANPE